MNRTLLALAVGMALCSPMHAAFAQSQNDGTTAAPVRDSVTTTSNTTNANATKRIQQLDAVQVSGA